jgi:hypothetical protein
LLWACGGGPAVTIANRSNVALDNVVVSGSGFSIPVGHLGVDETRSLSPHPRGESGIRVVFDAAGQHHDSGEQGYFEGGNAYRVSITVDTAMKVIVDSGLK